LKVLHRKLQISKHYFITPYSTNLFTIPIIISFHSESTTYQQLYEIIYKQVEFMLKTKKEDDKYPFELKYVNKDGTACSKCAWYRFCPGCDIPPTDEIISNNLNNFESICIEWSQYKSDLTFYRNETKTWFDEDKSIEVNREAQDTPLSFDQCMKWFTQEERIGDELQCSKCEAPKRTFKKMDLWKMPPFLIVHLKRFQFYNNRWKKSNRLVEFPLEDLRISEWLPKKKKNGEEAVYDLFAIVNHFGHLGSGHYTAYAKHQPEGVWYNFDDTHLAPVKDPKDLISRAGYLLFYKRRDINVDTFLKGDKIQVEDQDPHENSQSNHQSSDNQTSENGKQNPSTCNLM